MLYSLTLYLVDSAQDATLPDITVTQLLALLGFALTAALAAIAVRRSVKPTMTRLEHFIDDWNGQPARPGFKAIPSFPERMETVETATARNAQDIAKIIRTFEDALARVGGPWATHEDMERLEAAFSKLSQKFDDHEHASVRWIEAHERRRLGRDDLEDRRGPSA